ncbi:MAG: hypothetical protein ACFB16_08455 [Phormidesmis sp.]
MALVIVRLHRTGAIPINIVKMYLTTDMGITLTLQAAAELWEKAEQQHVPITSIDRSDYSYCAS